MKYLSFLVVSFCLLANQNALGGHSARIARLSDSEVGDVRTALGYSTVLQFDSKPVSAVLGDQDSFKLEYVGAALTLKPLLSNAKTNLFVFTDSERFNFRLTSGQVSQMDYVVKVKRKSIAQDSLMPDADGLFAYGKNEATSEDMTTIEINKSAGCGTVSMTIESISFPKALPWVVVNFTVRRIGSEGTNPIKANPESLFISEGNARIQIETLSLDGPSLPLNGNPLRGTALVKTSSPGRWKAYSLVFSPAPPEKDQCSALHVPLEPTKRRP